MESGRAECWSNGVAGNGVMEYWSDGWGQYSTTPLLHHSSTPFPQSPSHGYGLTAVDDQSMAGNE